MDTGRHSLKDISELVMRTQDPVGILVYGSRAIGASDAASDVDLVCVSRSDQNRHFVMTRDEVVIDIYASTFALLEKSIRSDSRTNNNFVLDAFAHGYVLVAGDGSTQALVSLAKEIWRAGPQQPGTAEQQSLVSVVEKALVAAKRLANKSEWSDEWREIAHIRCGYLFVEIVNAYCRMHRLWASSIWEMLRWTNPQYQDLIAICRNYLRATSFAERVAALEDLAELTMNRNMVSRQ